MPLFKGPLPGHGRPLVNISVGSASVGVHSPPARRIPVLGVTSVGPLAYRFPVPVFIALVVYLARPARKARISLYSLSVAIKSTSARRSISPCRIAPLSNNVAVPISLQYLIEPFVLRACSGPATNGRSQRYSLRFLSSGSVDERRRSVPISAFCVVDTTPVIITLPSLQISFTPSFHFSILHFNLQVTAPQSSLDYN